MCHLLEGEARLKQMYVACYVSRVPGSLPSISRRYRFSSSVISGSRFEFRLVALSPQGERLVLRPYVCVPLCLARFVLRGASDVIGGPEAGSGPFADGFAMW